MDHTPRAQIERRGEPRSLDQQAADFAEARAAAAETVYTPMSDGSEPFPLLDLTELTNLRARQRRERRGGAAIPRGQRTWGL